MVYVAMVISFFVCEFYAWLKGHAYLLMLPPPRISRINGRDFG